MFSYDSTVAFNTTAPITALTVGSSQQQTGSSSRFLTVYTQFSPRSSSGTGESRVTFEFRNVKSFFGTGSGYRGSSTAPSSAWVTVSWGATLSLMTNLASTVFSGSSTSETSAGVFAAATTQHAIASASQNLTSWASFLSTHAWFVSGGFWSTGLTTTFLSNLNTTMFKADDYEAMSAILGGSSSGTSLNSGSSTSSTSQGTLGGGDTYFLVTGTTSTSVSTTNTLSTDTTSSFRRFFSNTGTAGGTTSTSSSYGVITSASQVTTKSISTKALASYNVFAIVNRIISLDSTEWGWLPTTTGMGPMSALGTTFSETTFTHGAIGLSLSTWTPVTRTSSSLSSRKAGTGTTTASSSASSPVTFTTGETDIGKSVRTATLTVRTHITNSYERVNTPLSDSINISVTRTHSTTTTKTFTYHSTGLTTFSGTNSGYKSGLEVVQTFSDNFVTTMTDYPYTFSFVGIPAGTYYRVNEPEILSFTNQTISTSVNTSISSESGTTVSAVNTYSLINRTMSETVYGSSFSYTDTYAITTFTHSSSATHDGVTPGGIQLLSAASIGGTCGTAVGPSSLSITAFSSISPGVVTPLVADAETGVVTVGGSVNNTLRRADLTSHSIIGGSGWQHATSNSTIVEGSFILSRYTKRDSTSSTVGTYSWQNSTNDVVSVTLSVGEAIAMEKVPHISVDSKKALTRAYATFSAFPLS